MPTQTLFPPDMAIQDGPATTGSAETAAQPLEPLITGADSTLWVGFGAFIAIFLIVMISIIRSRVIKPAERAARATDFFEPAGAGADITFDDPAYAQVHELKKARKKKREEKAASRSGLDHDEPIDVDAEDADSASEAPEDAGDKETEPAAHTQMAEIAAAIDDAAATEPVEKEQAAPFANLFTQEAAPEEDTVAVDEGETVLTLVEAPADVRLDHLPEVDENYWDTERQRQETTAAYERAEEERLLALEEAERARADADAAHRRLDAEREASLRTADAEKATRRQAMSEMQGKTDAMADRLARDAETTESRIGASIEKKFSCLRDDLQSRLAAMTATVEKAQQNASMTAPNSSAAPGAMIIAQHLDALQKATESALSGLANRIDELSAAQASGGSTDANFQRLSAALAQRAAPAVAGALQLNDLVQSALPAGRFAFDRELSNGANADCLITRRGGDIAIDAGFPAEAFDRYARADDAAREHAATAYRRAILRHMIFVAEKLIAPEETADFAILFVPNDTIFNDLHQNFADIVQDSYRARIWITSPTSLMATLHMMNAAAAPDDLAPANDKTSLEKTIASLSARIATLEDTIVELKRKTVTAPAADPEPVEETSPDDNAAPASAADFSENDEAEVEIIGASSKPDDTASDENEDESARPPFPLR